jgi:hypothetical protein
VDCNKEPHTTGFGPFAESRNPIGEGLFPHSGVFIEMKLSAKASWWSPASEGPFAESRGSSSRCLCAERPQLLSAKLIFEKKGAGATAALTTWPPRPPPPGRRRRTPSSGRRCRTPPPGRRRRTPPTPPHARARTHTHTHLHSPPSEPTTVGSSRCARHHRRVVEACGGRIRRYRALPRRCSSPRGEGRAEGEEGVARLRQRACGGERRGTTPR